VSWPIRSLTEKLPVAADVPHRLRSEDNKVPRVLTLSGRMRWTVGWLMDGSRAKRAFDLWLAVADIPANEREDVLARLHGADPSLIADVLAIASDYQPNELPPTVSAYREANERRASRVLSSGTILHERYRIRRVIGGGGMGRVYEAVDLRLRNVVAVKQMTAEGGEADRAFEHEASLLASLRHSSVPVVIDYFVEENGRFLVMQFIEGDDLSLILEQHVACLPDELLSWGIALLNALEYLHTHIPQIVHRDIKPSNIRRTPRGELVLLDFGLAKGSSAGRNASAIVEHSVFGYTPSYSPFEQLTGVGTTPQSDLYSLGATLYHLSTGVKPSHARARMDARQRNQPDPLTPPEQLKSHLSARFCDVLMQAMALDPVDRFPSAAAMRTALLEENTSCATPQKQSRSHRRLDAAMPGQAEIEVPIDLIVQVRFADSPQLGLEDWPGRRRPSVIDQNSAAIRVQYPVDRRTGRMMPARLHLRILAPDFTIHGDAERDIEVPTDDYSPRVTFMLMALHAGWSRLTVDVYGSEGLYLGGVPMECEAIATAPSLQQPIVASVALVASPSAPELPRLGTAVIEPVSKADGSLVADAVGWGTTQREPSSHTAEAEDTEQVIRARPSGPARALGSSSMMRLGAAIGVLVLASVGIWRSGVFGPSGSRPATSVPTEPTVATMPTPLADPALPPPPAAAATAAGPTQVITITPVPTGGTIEGLNIICGTKGTACSTKYPEGVTAAFHPTADPNYTFMGFVGDCAPLGHTQMIGPHTCSATFALTSEVSKPLPIKPAPPVKTPVVAEPGSPATAPQSPPDAPAPPQSARRSAPAPVVGVGDKPAEPPPTPEEFAKGKIQETLKSYCAAYEAMDPAAVQQIYPKVKMKTLKEELNKSKYRSVRCTFGDVVFTLIDPEGGKAAVQAALKRVYEFTSVLEKPQTDELDATITLVRLGPRSQWQIEEARYRPKAPK
jgi:serine/threonine protein kinase